MALQLTDQPVQLAQQPKYDGYHDLDGRFVPFGVADEVFSRARNHGARVLLRLELNDAGQLQGLLYTNAKGAGQN